MTKDGDSKVTTQRDRFIEAARQLGADKDDGALDRVLGRVAPPVRPKKAGEAVEDGEAQERLVPK